LKHSIVLVALLISYNAKADQICDFENHCYSGQTYHMDLAHPDRETPPPAPQYPPPKLPKPHVVQYKPKTQCEIEHCYSNNNWHVPGDY
jgi:hypothetical protein